MCWVFSYIDSDEDDEQDEAVLVYVSTTKRTDGDVDSQWNGIKTTG